MPNTLLTPKIYIPNKGSHNYTDADRYGSVVYVTKGEQNRYAIGTMVRNWVKVLRASTPEDYILLSSLTNLCCIGCALFAMKHQRLNLLLFRNDKYIERKLELKAAFEEEVNGDGD
jgi:hypothetical protein